jgi:hypothetical protein
MAYTFSKNLTSTAFTPYMWWLKQALVAAGWTVQSSGNGAATYNASGDCFPTIGTWGATRSWFVVRDPSGAGGRSFCLQTGNDDRDFRIKYSASSGFSGGSPSANTTPTAADEVVVAGGGTDASPSYLSIFYGGGSAASTYAQIIADNAAPYSFMFLAYSSAYGLYSALGMDGVTATATGDLDPVVITVTNNNFSSTFGTQMYNNNTETSSPVSGWIAKGTGSAGFVYLTGLAMYGASGILVPAATGANALTSADDLFPLVYARPASWSAPRGYKGISTMVKWNGTSRALADTLSVASPGARDYIVIGQAALPWDGSVPSV